MSEVALSKQVTEACDQLRQDIGCDFVGLAMQNEVGPDVRWLYASGNHNEKYKRITVRFGKGMAGKVILTGSPMSVKDFPNGIQGKATEHPIMLAEKLVTAYAVPLFIKGIPKGVLLIGERASRVFAEGEMEKAKKSATILEEFLKELIVF